MFLLSPVSNVLIFPVVVILISGFLLPVPFPSMLLLR